MRFASYALQRFVAGLAVVILATLLVFVFVRLAPGDLAILIVAGPGGQGGVDMRKVEEVRQELGLDRPLLVQYLNFLRGLAQGDWGISYWTRRPLSEELSNRIPITIELALLSEFVAWLIAVPAGMISAVRRGSSIDAAVRLFVTIGLAIPVFWLGTLLLMILVVGFHWTPPLGMRPFREEPIAHLQQIALPVLTLGYVLSASLTRLIRGEMLEILSEPYIQVARAKGLSEAVVLVRHALRNALLPAMTYSAVRLGVLLGGIVVVETLFNIPGLGRFLVDAVLHRDYPALQLLVAMFAAIFVIINFIVDLLYLFVDPRLRQR